MMKRNLLLIVGLTASLLFSFGCTKKVDKNSKVLNMAVTAKVKGMDPIYANDRYSSNEVARIYEGLLEYHYLKRPFTLTPNLAEAMPVVSKDGLTYTFKIKKGVVFQDDKAFPNGKGRELVASDFVYSIMRLADPKLQSLGWWLIDGKIIGLNEWRKKYSDKKAANYAEVIEGIKALDSHTIEFKLTKPFPQFLYALAMPFTFAVAKEVVAEYKQEFLNHPVGTGPFVLKLRQGNKIIYLKNPTFRNKTYPTDASEDFVKKGFLADAGKKLPLLDKVVVEVMEESQPRWLNFQRGRLDFIGIPKDNFDAAIIPGKGLADDLQKKGIVLEVVPSLDVTYMGFNHDHKLFSSNIKLRQAMSLAYDVDESNRLFYNDKGIPAQSIVPPGIAGNIKGWKNPYAGFDLEKAKTLLAEAGYPKGKGLPEITYDVTANTTARQGAELFKKKMKAIGIKIKMQQNTWPELQKKLTTRNIMMWGMAWGADYPDAENFLQLLYCPNKAPGANGTDFCDPKFDKMYAYASKLQDSPERTAKYEEMNKYVGEIVPLIYGLHRTNYTIAQGWLKNYISSDFEAGQAQYLNIDLKEKEKTLDKF